MGLNYIICLKLVICSGKDATERRFTMFVDEQNAMIVLPSANFILSRVKHLPITFR